MQVEHETNRGWLQGCRKRCCVLARGRYRQKQRMLQYHREGIKNSVDPTEALERIDLLQKKYHWTIKAIAAETGIPLGSIQRWVRPQTQPRSLHRRHVHKLFLLPLAPYSEGLTDRSRVDATPYLRRVQAMSYRGFTAADIAKLCDLSDHVIRELLKGDHEVIEWRSANRIRAGFIHSLTLSDPEGAHADRTRKDARKRGYLPAGVWDDIDDPDCEPDSLQEPELQEAVERARSLAARGFQMASLARDSGISKANFYQFLYGNSLRATPETIKKINRVCDEYEVLPDPVGPQADKARTLAGRKGWRK